MKAIDSPAPRFRLVLLVAIFLCSLSSMAAERERWTAQERAVAFTIDDLPVVSNIPRNSAQLHSITDKLLATLQRYEIPAHGFVIGAKIAAQGEDHLHAWLDAGLQLGNHSYSHPDANAVGADSFSQDLMRGDAALRPLLQTRDQALEYFRFPMLRRGNTLALKQSIAEFIQSNGYISAPVSIDNQDWVFNRAYDRAIAAGNEALMEQIGLAYVDYLSTIFAFFETKSMEVLSYEPKQILLLHANAVNADYLDEIAEMLQRRGYRFITLQDALKDPLFNMPEHYIGNRGLSWIHRVAEGKGMPIEMEPHESGWLENLE